MLKSLKKQQCLPGCGACCIAPTISSALPKMPDGKPAGVSCAHLTPNLRCELFGHPLRPTVCEQFQAEAALCRRGPDHALATLARWEIETLPVSSLIASSHH